MSQQEVSAILSVETLVNLAKTFPREIFIHKIASFHLIHVFKA
jgi:hypothetical protein